MGLKRRELLFLVQAGDDCARISCEQLFMHFRDLTGGTGTGRTNHADGRSLKPRPAPPVAEQSDWWQGEPDSVIARESPEDFFHRLGETLRGQRRLELLETEWLEDTRLRRELERVLDVFRAAGGEIVFAAPARPLKASA